MVSPPIQLSADRFVGSGWPALIVAELGQNHNGCLDLAEELVDAAAWAGADAVKLVKRDLDCDLAREARERPYPSPHAFGRTYGQHRQALELSVDDHARLARRAQGHGLLYLCTACDKPSADLLDALGVTAFKVASRDLGNLPLLADLARRGRPVIASTGMSDWREIDAAVDALAECPAGYVLLHCTSLYPTPLADVHLRSLPALAQRYGSLVGFSDHSLGIALPPVAVALGAVVLEKHITLNRSMKGTDHACSIEPDELRQLVQTVRQVETALGSADKPLPSTVQTVRTRLGRSLVTRTNIPAGTRLEEPMLTLKCPGDGLPWTALSQVLGRTLRRDLPADEKLSVHDLL